MKFSTSNYELNHMVAKHAHRSPNQNSLHPFSTLSSTPDYLDEQSLDLDISSTRPDWLSNAATSGEMVYRVSLVFLLNTILHNLIMTNCSQEPDIDTHSSNGTSDFEMYDNLTANSITAHGLNDSASHFDPVFANSAPLASTLSQQVDGAAIYATVMSLAGDIPKMVDNRSLAVSFVLSVALNS